MTRPMVSCEGVGKRYRLGQLSGYRTFRDALADRVSSLAAKRRGEHDSPENERHLWALRDVSFDVSQGEALGIVGRNGSGKSTLLKVLSRVTYPTEGRATVRGRVGSLLEVGTGFHPELTGRENVYLRGAIIGMRRREIDRKFDEIVAFSGVKKFLDTPLKRYSSGMRVRLGFSVSAYLEPEVLFIDEVLAVGDVEFQGKCRDKMGSLISGGGTVLFVSHNVTAVKALCPRCILLEKGRIVADGPTEEVFDTYLAVARSSEDRGGIPDDAPRRGTGEARFRRVDVLGPDGRSVDEVRIGEKLRVRATIEVLRAIPDAVIEVGISTLDYVRVGTSFSLDDWDKGAPLDPGWYDVSVEMEQGLFARGYAIDVGLHHRTGATVDFLNRVAVVHVRAVQKALRADPFLSIQRGYYSPETRWGLLEQTNPGRGYEQDSKGGA